MIELSFEEIRDGEHFEDLVAEYFRDLRKLPENNILDVKVEPSGVGPDGGKDILVSLRVDDEISTFDRRWVIQCKFHKKNISP
ncbi:MAG: restriction endonuclease, partial [Bacteroidota bacterium]